MTRIRSSLLTLNGGDHLARVLACSEFQVPDPLPGARVQATVGDGHSDRCTDQTGFDVGLSIEIS